MRCKVIIYMDEAKRLVRMVYQVWNERGIGGLFRRVLTYALEYARGVWIRSPFFAPGEVLYISGCPGGSCRYRCDYQAESLVRAGVRAVVVAQHNPHLEALVKKFRIFVLQRVVWNERLAQTVMAIKQRGGTLLFETDDLVFDPAYLLYMDYYRHMVPREKRWYENGIGRELLEDASMKRCIVSTDFLAEALRKKYPDKEVFVSYNKLGRAQVAAAEKALEEKSLFSRRDGKIRIGYFSGSRSHDKDFECVSDVLLCLLRENGQIVLVVVGHLDLPEKFNSVRSQVEKIPFVPIEKLPGLIFSTDVSIAPLEVENPFCQAKSAIKFFEAGILGVPTVAAATGDFVRCIENGKNGFVARTEEEWHSFLSKLISDRSLRERLGNQARLDVLAHHTTESQSVDAKRLLAFLRG